MRGNASRSNRSLSPTRRSASADGSLCVILDNARQVERGSGPTQGAHSGKAARTATHHGIGGRKEGRVRGFDRVEGILYNGHGTPFAAADTEYSSQRRAAIIRAEFDDDFIVGRKNIYICPSANPEIRPSIGHAKRNIPNKL